MQLRLTPRNSKNLISRNLIIKIFLIILLFFVGVFLIDKIDFPTPKQIIKQEISNEKLITIK